jgi:hypothetical protein
MDPVPRPDPLHASLLLAPLLLAFGPVASMTPTANAAPWDGEAWADYSAFLFGFDETTVAHLHEIRAVGETLGREPGRMGQIGDSITEAVPYFRSTNLNGAVGNETGHDYDPVRSWLAYDNAMPADANSFYRDHGKGEDYGCVSGWTLASAVSAGHPAQGVSAGDGVTPGDYSWALIMFGTNDIDSGSWNAATWKETYRAFVQGYVDLGVVPVLSTIPPEFAHIGDGRVQLANDQIRALAAELVIPYVDFYALILHYQPTDWHGTLISSDGTHPSAGGSGRDFSQGGLTSTDGYAARTKLTLDAAERMRDLVFDDATPIERESWGTVRARYRSR